MIIKKRAFSAVQPSGDLHIGNYIGAIKQWVQTQNLNENIYCIVDLHALTIPENINPSYLKAKTREVAKLYIACGLNPDTSIIFAQSHVKEHAELAWLLNCVTPLGWLNKMTQFKSKSDKVESIGTGLLDYPVLQAADILLYQTDIVPVGEDQRQHIELCRNIAVRFNNLFGDTFKIPELVIPKTGARIMGLDSPEDKMSKSVGAGRKGHSINLLDDDSLIKKTIMSAVTDNLSELRFDHASPGVLNLLTIYEALTGKTRNEIELEFNGKGYGFVKKSVVEVVVESFRPIKERYSKLSKDEFYIEKILSVNALKATEIAFKTINLAKSNCGVGI